MAIFGGGKGKEDPATVELILAYLEDAHRCRSPFTVANGKGRETSALLHSLHPGSRSFRLLPKDDLPFEQGARAGFTLIHEGLRIGGAGRVLEARTGVLALQFPEALELMERRTAPRVRLNPKELATLAALQELSAGVGLTGGIENLSERGARVRVDKALAIGTEKRLVLGTNLVAPGQRFAAVTLNQVPLCPPVLETEGKAVYLAYEAGGLAMGFAFTQAPGAVADALRSLAAQRGSPLPTGLPAKPRRQAEPEPPPSSGRAGRGGSAVPDRRHAVRLSLERGHRARFMVGDLLVDQAELTDISLGGCCLRLVPEQCQGLRKGTALDEFHLLHEDLPKGVLPCRVKWVLGRPPGTEDAGPGQRYCLVGVEFLQAPEPLTRAIEAFVSRHLP